MVEVVSSAVVAVALVPSESGFVPLASPVASGPSSEVALAEVSLVLVVLAVLVVLVVLVGPELSNMAAVGSAPLAGEGSEPLLPSLAVVSFSAAGQASRLRSGRARRARSMGDSFVAVEAPR
ncbi:hypothetical protein OV203_25515 [Nannocystis sp. ILAH1]|uniref:hypothetical protein n=1 Tax=Nannocystis sp. ILAH1 TaxID=2996789 RepID=UPI00226F0223|nr:hypothetical protein [Nannocystis sp. ILAH1]MCY0990526.1 hypothetical protein [Nannocystis sp. ILAH1]